MGARLMKKVIFFLVFLTGWALCPEVSHGRSVAVGHGGAPAMGVWSGYMDSVVSDPHPIIPYYLPLVKREVDKESRTGFEESVKKQAGEELRRLSPQKERKKGPHMIETK